jgi:hypothetical protein
MGASVIPLRSRPLCRVIVSAIFCVMSADALFIVLRYGFDHDHVFGLADMFGYWNEQNVPTFVSTLLMLVCALLLLATGAATRQGPGNSDARLWFGLSAVFVFLAFDESMQFHDTIEGPLGELLGFGESMNIAWVPVYVAVMLVLAGLYSGFLWRLPADSRALFFLSGALFVGGAVGIEAIESEFAERGRFLGRDLLIWLEESLELSGTGLFAYALVRHAERHLGGIRLRLGAPDPDG